MAATAAVPTLELLHGEIARLVEAGARIAVKAPPPWAALLLGAGLVYLLLGARERHVLALPGGAALGLLAARLFVTAMDGPGAAVQEELLWVSAGAGALACGGWPPLFPPLALAIPGLAIGSLLPIAGHAWLGALAGGAGGALVGALSREWVASLAAGGLGGGTALAGAIALLAKQPLGRMLRDHPMALVAAWAVLAVAGAAFHAGRAWPAPRSRPDAPEPYAGELPLHEGAQHDEWRG